MKHELSPLEIGGELTRRILAAAFEVHTILGPGLDESTYERALCLELEMRGIEFQRQPRFPIEYKGVLVGMCRPDLVVENEVIVELKACEELTDAHKAQVVKYLHHTKRRIGLLLNFNVASLTAGIRRLTLTEKN